MSENHFVERILTKQGVWSGDVRGGAPLLLPGTRVRNPGYPACHLTPSELGDTASRTRRS